MSLTRGKILLTLLLCFPSMGFAQNLLPLKGKWNPEDGRDYTGVWDIRKKQGYLDGRGNGWVTGLTAVLGDPGDLPLTLDYTGDNRDEFALYRPRTGQIFFFADFTNPGSIELLRVVGRAMDIPFAGDWDGDGRDGFAMYSPQTSEISFYQDIDSKAPFYTKKVDAPDLIPMAGNWDGLDGDGLALFSPLTGEVTMYQNVVSANPMRTTPIAEVFDHLAAGDWNGDGTDEFAVFRNPRENQFEFWFFKSEGRDTFLTYPVQFSTDSLFDISHGRMNFYRDHVPQVDSLGNFRRSYEAGISFLPRGIYNATPGGMMDINNAGFNLAMLWPTYEIDSALHATLDLTGNNLRLIQYVSTPGGNPFVGKFSGKNDLIGISSIDNSRIFYFDSDGDKIPDQQFLWGAYGDRAETGDWNGDGRDEFCVHRASTREVYFFADINARKAFFTAVTGTNQDALVSGDWNGDGIDGYALMNPNGEVAFYQTINDPVAFASRRFAPGIQTMSGDWDGDGTDGIATFDPKTNVLIFYQTIHESTELYRSVFGSQGDIAAAGDWDGDGKDGIAVYRTDRHKISHHFYLLDSLGATTPDTIEFDNPLISESLAKHVFGVYTCDEPTGVAAEREIKFQELRRIYEGYASRSAQVFFHADVPYPDDASSREWWERFALMGEVVAHDDYPLRNSSTPSTLRSLGSIATTITRARETTGETLPNWFVPQAFAEPNGGSLTFHKPTPQQYRAMVYTSIVHGATGILTFAYDNKMFPHITGISSENDAALWESVTRVNFELERLKKFILSNTHPAEYLIYTAGRPVHDPNPVRSLLKYADGQYILIAVNMTAQPLNTIIQLPAGIAPENGTVESYLNGTLFQTASGAINYSFTPFGVEVFRFSASGKSADHRMRTVEDLTFSLTPEECVVYPNPGDGFMIFEVRNITTPFVRLTILDSHGRTMLVEDQENEKGYFRYRWNRETAGQDRLVPGVYFYRITGTSTEKSGRFVIR